MLNGRVGGRRLPIGILSSLTDLGRLEDILGANHCGGDECAISTGRGCQMLVDRVAEVDASISYR